jgi:hypothetical protein
MCDVTERSESPRAVARPLWGALYTLAGVMLAALALAETLVPQGAELTALQCGLVLTGFGAMVGWTLRNRAALDRLDWCDCASARVTVRVIPSHRRQRVRVMVADALVPVEARAPVEMEPEEVAR